MANINLSCNLWTTVYLFDGRRVNDHSRFSFTNHIVFKWWNIYYQIKQLIHQYVQRDLDLDLDCIPYVTMTYDLWRMDLLWRLTASLLRMEAYNCVIMTYGCTIFSVWLCHCNITYSYVLMTYGFMFTWLLILHSLYDIKVVALKLTITNLFEQSHIHTVLFHDCVHRYMCCNHAYLQHPFLLFRYGRNVAVHRCIFF